jgi:hypothetical protein
MSGTNGRNLPRAERRLWIVGSLGTAMVCLIMVASGAASASITYSGPWGKALVTPSNVIVEESGCAKLTGKAATFSKSTGIVRWDGTAMAQSCKSKLGSGLTSNALEQYASGITYPVRVPVGVHSEMFNVTWNITSTANYTLSYSGSCPQAVNNTTLGFNLVNCEAEAISQVISYADLVDLTTGAIYYPTTSSGNGAFAYSYVENESYCYSGSCYFYNSSVSTPWSHQSTTTLVSFSINATTTGKDKYAIFTYAGGDIVDEFEIYHGKATGSINMGTGGNQAKLVSIVES